MKTLPSLDEDLAPPQRLNLRAIQPKPQADDAAITENSRKLGARWGVQTSHGADIIKTPIASLRIEVPEYLDRELALKAVELRVTKQFLVIRALQAAGFHVAPTDMIADRRKSRKK